MTGASASLALASANTLAALRAQTRVLLASTEDWPDATLDAFISDAIRFYSHEFPKRWRHTLPLVAGQQAYPLPAGAASVLSVEYPAGQRPPRFLERSSPWAPGFGAGAPAYALRGADDGAAGSEAGELLFAEAVAAGQEAVIEYFGLHALPQADGDPLTVPQAHWEALVAFVDFRCHWELETDEAATVTNISVILSQLGEEGRRAWIRFKEVMARLEWTDRGQSAVVAWGGRRIY
jgi:hypothetical protein